MCLSLLFYTVNQKMCFVFKNQNTKTTSTSHQVHFLYFCLRIIYQLSKLISHFKMLFFLFWFHINLLNQNWSMTLRPLSNSLIFLKDWLLPRCPVYNTFNHLKGSILFLFLFYFYTVSDPVRKPSGVLGIL